MSGKDKNRDDGKEKVHEEIRAEGKGEGESAPTTNGAQEPEGKKELSPEEKIRAQLEEKTREAGEYQDKWLRSVAEMENFKKRMQKEKAEVIRFANENLLRALLPTVDNLERAINHGRRIESCAPLLEGVEISLKHFLNTLEKFGVKPIPARGEVFDPEKHEAVSQQESEMESERVAEEVEKGYTFHDRLLRPAKVIVSKSREEKKN